jgi:hypothetical protein
MCTNRRILGNNNAMSFVLKIKLKSTNRSISSCVRNTETDEHIFLSCFNVSQLWKNLNNWVFANTQIELQFNLEHVLFGLLYKTEEKICHLLEPLTPNFATCLFCLACLSWQYCCFFSRLGPVNTNARDFLPNLSPPL